MRWLGLRSSSGFNALLTLCLKTLLLFQLSLTASAQESEQATRQFAVAVGFQNQKLYEPAIEEWQTFIKKFADDPRLDKATHYLGTCQLQAKQFSDAVETFESILKTYPKSELLDQSLLNLGTAKYSIALGSTKAEDYAKAEAVFAKLATDFPKSEYAARAVYYRGESLYHQNKFDEAAQSYEQVVKSFPKDALVPDAWYALGICQESLKQTGEAQKTFATFQTRFPKHALLTEVRMRQAEALFADGKFVEAQKQFALVSSVKEFSLADTAMLRQARCLYEQDKFDEAGTLYWNVPREFPKTKHYDTAVLAGAKCYYLIGKYALARSGLENVAKRDVPEAAEASQWIGRSLLKEKNPLQAQLILEEAIARHPNSAALPQLMLARIDAMYELPGRRQETAALYAEFAQKYPQDELAAQARYMSALTALDIGDHAAAKLNSDLFEKQFAADSLLPDVLFIGAEARLLLKEFADAQATYGRFLKLAPTHVSSPLAKVRLGLALQLDKQFDKSLAELQAALPELKDASLKSEALAIIARCFLGKEELPKAADSFEASLKAQGDREQSDQTLLSLADVYRRLDRPADSITRLNQLRTKFPNSQLLEEATFRLGEAAYSQNDFDRAIMEYSNVVKTWPNGTFAPNAQYGIGWSQFKKNNFAGAVEAVTSLSTRYTDSDLAKRGLYIRAMAEFQLGQFAEASASAQSFLKSKPAATEGLDASYLLGLALAGQQKFSDAARTYSAILESDPQYADADKVLYELGWAYLELGQADESIAAFQRLGADYPGSPLAVESLFRVAESHYDAGKYDAAAKAYSETTAIAGASELGEKAAHKLAWTFFKTDKLNEAAEAFAGQLKNFPTGPLAADAEFLRGECLYKQDQWQAAFDQYAKTIGARHPTYEALAIYRSAECAAALEKWDVSLKLHQRVLKGFPTFELKAEARYGVGWALQQQEKLAEAIATYETVTEETESETAAKARFMIGECYFAQKNHKEATKHFLKAAFAYGHKEWSAMAWFEAARCFEVLRDIDQAKNCYQQMIEKYPEHPKVTDAKKRLSEL